MKTRIEIKIELASRSLKAAQKEGLFYFVIAREPGGYLEFKFTDKRGHPVDPKPFNDTDLFAISRAIRSLVKSSDSDEG
jgi:hypothetical protein